MNLEQLTKNLNDIRGPKEYQGDMTKYAVQSIESGRSNYPVSNFIDYCKGIGVKVKMVDMATEDYFVTRSVLEVHKIIEFLMCRYDIDKNTIYRKTGIHYTPVKTYDEKSKNFSAPISIKTLLAVCEAMHCELVME